MLDYVQENSDFHLDLTSWRRDLHAHPETAYQEIRTANFITQVLSEYDVELTQGLAGTGVIATIHGELGDGDAIGLRADMDALDISELNQFEYCSNYPGKMHACGHDGHTVMLLGAAICLAKSRQFYGKVHCIFQPAEENEAGAKAMIKDGLFERFPMKAVYGLHNWPALPVGQAAVHTGPVMAAFDTFDLIVKGEGGHGAMPNQTVDPIYAASLIVNALQSIVSRNLDPQKAGVVSVTQINAGHAYNVIPDSVSLKGTTRSFCPEVRDQLEQRMTEIVEHIAKAQGCQASLTYTRRYPATVNHAKQAKQCFAVLSDMAEISQVLLDPPASMGGEDFAFMLEQCPGAYIWLGSGDDSHGYNLHHPHFDFNDAIIPHGTNFWLKLVKRLLSSPTVNIDQ
ncbi:MULTISPECIES: M20 aminoacylase family protein [unclassified Vibrio]|uniref:M20 aminoacylase family protein n=1 Tax=Vibrio sp. HB236076 TaxID=3232307 RepID=A0AB39HBT0_9VIBR|nr:M20 aminoacylase family protein [Vibrio sp. HB161653]MDP5253455.1 M20 aminoacylase family protein [Vibrio sp. HB161653]